MNFYFISARHVMQCAEYRIESVSVSISNMTWVIVGLGNPDEEYLQTRHNAGRMAVEAYAKVRGLSDWKEDKKSKALVARGAVGRAMTVCVLPNTYMNKSGVSVAHYIHGLPAAERLIVIYDELDLPLGTVKISFDRGAGGHKGVDSVMKAVKTRRFTRIRIGISPVDTEGVMHKPRGAKVVNDFVLGRFAHAERPVLESTLQRICEAIDSIITEGWVVAMNKYN